MEPRSRAAAARRADRGARRWAPIVMGVAFPLVLVALSFAPVVRGRGSLPLSVLRSLLLCGACWCVWVGAAALAGWCRNR